MNIGILGGGISGLTLQRFLRHPSEVLEKEPDTRRPVPDLLEGRLRLRHRRPYPLLEAPARHRSGQPAARRQHQSLQAGQQDSLQGPLRQVSFRERPRLAGETRLLRLPDRLPEERLPGADQPRGMGISHVRPVDRGEVFPSLQPQDLEDGTAGDGAGVGGQSPQAAAGGRGQVGAGDRDRGLHPSTSLSLPAPWRLRVAGEGDDRGRVQGSLQQPGPIDPQERERLDGCGGADDVAV